MKQATLVSLFKDDFIIPINSASRSCLNWLLDGILHNMDQSNKSSIFFIFCADSDLCIGLLCSDQLFKVLLMVSQT